jgi:uncharacterized protein
VAAFFAHGTYSASKAWVVSFSESMAAELAGSRVRVMALCPGFVRTEFHDRASLDMSGIPEFLWLSADNVVSEAMRDLARGAWVSIPDLRYKVIARFGKLVPHRLASEISRRFVRR